MLFTLLPLFCAVSVNNALPNVAQTLAEHLEKTSCEARTFLGAPGSKCSDDLQERAKRMVDELARQMGQARGDDLLAVESEFLKQTSGLLNQQSPLGRAVCEQFLENPILQNLDDILLGIIRSYLIQVYIDGKNGPKNRHGALLLLQQNMGDRHVAIYDFCRMRCLYFLAELLNDESYSGRDPTMAQCFYEVVRSNPDTEDDLHSHAVEKRGRSDSLFTPFSSTESF